MLFYFSMPGFFCSVWKMSLCPHLMTSLICTVREFCKLFVLVNCVSPDEITQSRPAFLHNVHLWTAIWGVSVTGIKLGVVVDVSEVPVWPAEAFYCGALLYSHSFCRVFAWEGKSSAQLVVAGLGNLWGNSSELTYGTLYMESIILL